jgi:hypothetical protein
MYGYCAAYRYRNSNGDRCAYYCSSHSHNRAYVTAYTDGLSDN